MLVKNTNIGKIIPDDINELTENLNVYRQTLKGNFKEKVQKLNDLTKDMIDEK